MKKILTFFSAIFGLFGMLLWASKSGKRKGIQKERVDIAEKILHEDKEFQDELSKLPEDEAVKRLDNRIDDQLAALRDKLS